MPSVSIFERIIQTQIPRILGFAGRLADSPTYGCFDRYYWHYKLIDFPNARFQEAVLALTLSYLNPEIKPFYSNQNLRKWIQAGIGFWAKMQRGDGSFDEAYPHEHSLVASAFSTTAIARSVRLLDLNIQGITSALINVGDWLNRHQDSGPTNQTIGAATALNEIFQVTGVEKYRRASWQKLDQSMMNWKKEGFFMEYGGFDVGYSTIALSYLALLYLDNKEDWVKEICLKAIDKIRNTLDENCIWNYQRTSRKTQYVYPMSFSVFEAFDMVERYSLAVRRNEAVTPLWMDDRYSLPLTVDYLLMLHFQQTNALHAD